MIGSSIHRRSLNSGGLCWSDRSPTSVASELGQALLQRPRQTLQDQFPTGAQKLQAHVCCEDEAVSLN